MTPFHETYKEFVAERGNLFESAEISLGEADKKELERLHKFSRNITYPFFLSVGIIGLISGVYVLFSPYWYMGIGIMLASFGIGSFSFYYKSHYNELLQHGKKRMIIGIITRIRKSGSYYIGITLSQKEEIFFLKEQAKGFSLGDIVRCETMSKAEDANRRIERMGSMYDYIEKPAKPGDQ
jgi:hypothetical protein